MINKSVFIGQYISDITKNYDFEQELGSGAYGKVFRIKHRETNNYYACKRMNKRQISNKERFKIEIDLLKATDHPYIVKLVELYEDNVYLYLVMEECKGGELFDRLAERAKSHNLYTEKESCEIFKKIINAINYCHSHGVCHRDIKPENILFSDKNDFSSLKVVDFGLSRVFSSEDKVMTSVVGTTFYMAPEVINGKYNEKCDIWSAGCILYIMLCGRPPFYAKNDSELIRKINAKAYSFNYPEFSVISSDAKDLITRMLCDEDKRLSAQGVLDHTWIKNNAPNSKEKLLNLNFHNVTHFVAMNKLKKSVFSFIATRLNSEETTDLAEAFNAFDKNRDGVITMKEAKEGILYMKQNSKGNIKEIESIEQNLSNIFRDVDLDQNGQINYSEFIAASLDHQKMLRKEMIYEAFKTFDSNHAGKLSMKNLMEIVRPVNKQDIEYLKELFNKYDTDKNGFLDYNEFMRLFDSDKE